MVELKTKITKTGVLYIPKEIREAFFPADADYQDVLKSLEIIAADLRHRIEMQEREASAE